MYEEISGEKGDHKMLAAVKGVVQGNTVVIKDDDIREYDGVEVVVTLLDHPLTRSKKCQSIGIVLLCQVNVVKM